MKETEEKALVTVGMFVTPLHHIKCSKIDSSKPNTTMQNFPCSSISQDIYNALEYISRWQKPKYSTCKDVHMAGGSRKWATEHITRNRLNTIENTAATSPPAMERHSCLLCMSVRKWFHTTESKTHSGCADSTSGLYLQQLKVEWKI